MSLYPLLCARHTNTQSNDKISHFFRLIFKEQKKSNQVLHFTESGSVNVKLLFIQDIRRRKKAVDAREISENNHLSLSTLVVVVIIVALLTLIYLSFLYLRLLILFFIYSCRCRVLEVLTKFQYSDISDNFRKVCIHTSR